MVTPDKAAFESLIKSTMGQYHQYIKSMESAWDTVTDEYGDIVAVVPFLKIELKDDVDILNELSERKNIKIVNRR